MNILFLGGNRYFGKEILISLLKKKHKVFLINRGSKFSQLNHKHLIYLKCDRKNIKQFKDLYRDVFFDVIFDNIAYKLEDVKILLKVFKGKFKHYIFTSSVITYLGLYDKIEVKEKEWSKGKVNRSMINKYKPIDISYAINKKKIEKFLINNKKIKSTIVRIPAVIGINDFSKKTERLIAFQFNNNKNIDRNDFIQFIYKPDLVKVIIKLIEKKTKESQIFNVANKKIRIKDFYKKISKLDKFYKKKYLPYVNDKFPLPLNSLINCEKIKKNMNINFTSINKVINSIY